MSKKDIFIITSILSVMMLSLIIFGLYVEKSKIEVVTELPEENDDRSAMNKVKEIFEDFGVDLKKTQGVNRTYIGDDEAGIVVNVPRNPLIGGNEVKEKEYNSIVDILYMFEEDLNIEDGTKYFGLDNQFYTNKEDALEFLSYFFNEDIKYSSIVNAYSKIDEGIYYVKAKFIQFNYGEEKDISDFNKIMEFTVDVNNNLIYPSKFVKTVSFKESITLPDCSVLIDSADFYINELFINTEIFNLSSVDFNFKDRYTLIVKAGEMKLDKGFDIYTTDYDLMVNAAVNMIFKYVYIYTPEISFEIKGRE